MTHMLRRLICLTLLGIVLVGCRGSDTHPSRSPSASSDAGIQPPYPVPASCAVAHWTSNQERRKFSAAWLDGDGVAAGDPLGPVLFEGWQKIQWQADPEGVGTLTVTGQRLDAPAPPPEAQNVYEVGAATWSSGTVFPAPGCWRLQATAGIHHLDTIVYVYPMECRPTNLRDPSTVITKACIAP